MEVMGVERRKGKIHDAFEDAKLAWHVAGVFYKMDNRIKTPGSKPDPLSRSDKFDVGAIIVFVLLAWWFFTEFR